MPTCEVVEVVTRPVQHQGVGRILVTASLTCGHEARWFLEPGIPRVHPGDRIPCHGCARTRMRSGGSRLVPPEPAYGVNGGFSGGIEPMTDMLNAAVNVANLIRELPHGDTHTKFSLGFISLARHLCDEGLIPEGQWFLYPRADNELMVALDDGYTFRPDGDVGHTH